MPGNRSADLLTVILILALGTAPACSPSKEPAKAADPGIAASAGTPLAPLPFDHFLGYDELTALLRGWAAARPDLLELRSLGTTPGGRELWFATITNRATGPAMEKPALLVDGNMHALEWTGGVAAVNFIWTLLRDHGRDERVTRLVDSRCLYVLPRLSPDGVEATLQEGQVIRSAARPNPDGSTAPGLRLHDIDGDGQVVFMRFRDPNGPWKTHPDEPRLLIARQPDETGGVYWRVVPEGTIQGYDGETITVLPALEGLDFGMFFPDDRDPLPPGATASPGPGLVPEVAAYVEAIRGRPNIVAYVSCHSFGGGLLMPPINPGEDMPQSDRFIYATVAEKATELTTYDAMTYFDLRAGQNLDVHIPTEIGWLYNSLGIFSYITEFWNPLRAAGITLTGRMSLWLGGLHPVEDELRLLRWNDRELGGKGFVRWHEFHHPQLGLVEIGGWDKIHYWYNVPLEKLRQEVAPHADWLVYLALSSPRLEIRSLTAEPAGNDEWRVRLVVENSGWLPTNGAQKALDRKIVDGIVAELALPPGARLVDGGPRRELGQLAGRSEQRSTATWWGYAPGTPDRAVVEWKISAPAGTSVSVTASHVRAGTVRAKLLLGRER
jgi:murein tripeptide amidase MpaA